VMLTKGRNAAQGPRMMTWAGAGILRALRGGIPRSFGLIGDAVARESNAFSFLQICGMREAMFQPGAQRLAVID
jgi:hypothetical protein